MIGRAVLAVLLAGIAAGLVMGVIQHVRLTPLILEAEVFERAGGSASHSHGAAPEAGTTAESGGHDHDHGEGWKPEDGWPRTLATTFTAAMTGAGFAAILAAVSLLTGLQISRKNGILWGLCGFLAVTLAPAAGLPPELPGMTAADLFARQVWWVGTIAATAAGIYLFATQTRAAALVLAAVLILAPHVIGAPVPPQGENLIPAELIARFVSNSIAANAVFWCIIGVFLGLVLGQTAKDIYAT
ncbi:MAG: CbtA family protein [Aestuariivirga sp.]|uniref:CbtA family protein n=1 Tax=Aestuariivirga sp. TaxID=2650926 RepID=UPI0025BC87A1|nr:CbtA family protein [Aestuariivirga sp.]MCA3560284.1 CbtA family protein [Aestuariivirga sp.]